jgi:hypothetical protein
MFRKLIYLVSFVLVLSLVLSSVANASTNWTGADPGDDLWSTAANWSAAVCLKLEGPGHGASGTNIMNVTGGSLTVVSQWIIGHKSSSTATVYMSGGSVSIATDMLIGKKGPATAIFDMTGGTLHVGDQLLVARKNDVIGTLNMYGGTITCAELLIAPEDSQPIGTVNLYGGTIDCNQIGIADYLAGSSDGIGLLNLQGGTLLINADAMDVVTEYVNLGKITADGGGGANAVSVTYDEVTGVTTVVAIDAACASNPSPADKETDVQRDVVLSWTQGAYAPPVNGHRVYLSDNFDDVSNGLANADRGLTSDPEFDTANLPLVLSFDTTYYWRIDEANSVSGWDQGDVWQFTIEPFVYAVENITATASSSDIGRGPENTVNSSGLDANDLHSIVGTDMWLSSAVDPNATWIQYEFDRVYKLHQMWVWNHNGEGLNTIYGLKDVTIEYSVDGETYTQLGTYEFAEAPGVAGYAHNTTVDFGKVVAKYVRISANSNWSGGIVDQYGLSEVRFFYIPVHARQPNPDSGATNVDVDNVTLNWRAGREAASHNLYFSADEQAVIDETISPVSIPAGSSYANYATGPLDLNKSYYWKVNEVNEAETPTTWESNIWSFTTSDNIVVEDFESYNDLEPGDPESNRIFHAWIDGFEDLTNGSIVGYAEAPFAEQTIVHGGQQSMPLIYDNSTANYSEATANVANLAIGQDWTKYGITALSLWFYGDPGNAAEQLYVKLNGSKVTYDGDAANLTQTAWQPWNIELASFGVNLSNVTELIIGLERIGLVGSSGVVYFDDIRLYP